MSKAMTYGSALSTSAIPAPLLCTVFFEEDFGPYFKTIEPIFRKYQGRPHWGKLNNLTREDFAQLYPRWSDFTEVRKQLDPDGKFLNPYLKQLFG